MTEKAANLHRLKGLVGKEKERAWAREHHFRERVENAMVVDLSIRVVSR